MGRPLIFGVVVLAGCGAMQQNGGGGGSASEAGAGAPEFPFFHTGNAARVDIVFPDARKRDAAPKQSRSSYGPGAEPPSPVFRLTSMPGE